MWKAPSHKFCVRRWRAHFIVYGLFKHSAADRNTIAVSGGDGMKLCFSSKKAAALLLAVLAACGAIFLANGIRMWQKGNITSLAD